MSWLHLQQREEEGATECNFPLYLFGSDSFVRRFYSDHCLGENGHRSASAWRISTGRTPVLGGVQGPSIAVILNRLRCHRISLRALIFGPSIPTSALTNSGTNSKLPTVQSLIAGTTLTAATTTICPNLSRSLIRKILTLLMFTLSLMGSRSVCPSSQSGISPRLMHAIIALGC